MQFCSFSRTCLNVECGRNFTEAEAKEAEEWWKLWADDGKAPIAFTNYKTDSCGFILRTEK